MNKFRAEYDKSAITPSVGTGAVGRVGGSDDDTFGREDGSEVRGAHDDAPAEQRGPVPGDEGPATAEG
jgi:hypothetical protein